MHIFSFIIWNFDPELYSGTPTIRWYGLLFALGFLISQQIMFYVFKTEAGNDLQKKKDAEKLIENFTVYMIIATIVGARLGHVVFYQPQDYFTSFSGLIRIFNIREGGLASHGAFFGLSAGVWLFVHYRFNLSEGKFSNLFFIKTNRGYGFLQIVDRLVIVVAITGTLIRIGNFANSEIVGKPTHSDYGVVFAREANDYLTYDATGAGWVEKVEFRKNPKGEVNEAGSVPIFIYVEFKNRTFDENQLRSYLDNAVNQRLARVNEYIDEPLLHNLDYELVKASDGTYTARIATFGIARHPAQLYESLSTFLIFLLTFMLWRRKKKDTAPGSIFGIFMIALFTLRFFHEMLKENQVAFEDTLPLNMGQWLSIPMVLVGIIALVWSSRHPTDQGTGS